MFLWAIKKRKSLDEESAFGKKKKKVIRRRRHDSSSVRHDGTLLPQTAQEEHFIYLSLPYLALYTSLQSLPEKNCLSAKISVWKGGPFPLPTALGYFYPHPSTSPCPRPSIPPSPGDFPAPICTLLVTLSTYLVPTECLCNQTYTYPVVRHSNGRLIMKLHRCELTTG